MCLIAAARYLMSWGWCRGFDQYIHLVCWHLINRQRQALRYLLNSPISSSQVHVIIWSFTLWVALQVPDGLRPWTYKKSGLRSLNPVGITLRKGSFPMSLGARWEDGSFSLSPGDIYVGDGPWHGSSGNTLWWEQEGYVHSKVPHKLYEINSLWVSNVPNISGFAQLSHQFLMILDPLHGRGRFGQVLSRYLKNPYLPTDQADWGCYPISSSTAGELVQDKLKGGYVLTIHIHEAIWEWVAWKHPSDICAYHGMYDITWVP